MAKKGQQTDWGKYEETVEKFIHLQNSLEENGEEFRAIKALQLTEANYPIAISTLESRFGNQQRQGEEHMLKLLHPPRCYDMRDTARLREVYDSFCLNMKALDAVGIKLESYAVAVHPKFF